MSQVLRAAKRQINIRVSQHFYEKLEKLANEANETVVNFAGLLLDAAYAAKAGAPKNAPLDAHVALVGLSTQSGALREELALGTGLPVEVIQRMQDAWTTVLRERRFGK